MAGVGIPSDSDSAVIFVDLSEVLVKVFQVLNE